jgi:opacity protein-like surface antigen
MSISFRHLITVLVLAAPATALAQEPTSPAAPEPAPKKIQLSAGLFFGMPQGDFKESGGMDVVGNSPGLVIGGGYQVIPKLSVMAVIHYFAVASETDGVDLSMWDVGLGARYAHPISPVLSVYGEGYVQRVSYSQEAGGSSADASGIGFVVGGGVQYALKPNVALGGGLTYSAADLEPDQGESMSSGWLSLNAFAAYHL